MNATKFLVLLLIGVVYANVGARQLEPDESKETKVSISILKTATTKGLGAELASVNASTDSSSSGYSSSNAAWGPSSGDTFASGGGFTTGTVSANGPSANGYSSSGTNGQGITSAQAGPDGVNTSGNGFGGGSSFASGNAGPSPP